MSNTLPRKTPPLLLLQLLCGKKNWWLAKFERTNAKRENQFFILVPASSASGKIEGSFYGTTHSHTHTHTSEAHVWKYVEGRRSSLEKCHARGPELLFPKGRPMMLERVHSLARFCEWCPEVPKTGAASLPTRRLEHFCVLQPGLFSMLLHSSTMWSILMANPVRETVSVSLMSEWHHSFI